MAKTSVFTEIEGLEGFFPAGSNKMVERLLKRAAEKEAKRASKGVAQALCPPPAGSRRRARQGNEATRAGPEGTPFDPANRAGHRRAAVPLRVQHTIEGWNRGLRVGNGGR